MVIISLTTFIVSYLLTVKTEELVENDSRIELRHKVDLITSTLPVDTQWTLTGLEERFQSIAAAANTRITIIAGDGKVVFESELNPSHLANHTGRPELLQAWKEGYGQATRTSSTLGQAMMYMAKKLETDQGTMFLRLAMPQSRLNLRLDNIRYALGIGALVGMILSLCTALFLARRVTKPISAITLVAEAISRGNYNARLRKLPRNELGTLGGAINRLAEAVEANINKREKMEKIKREFSSNISHELKTPLTSIKGYVETLLGGALDDKDVALRFLEIIKSNINRIISLVNDLMNLATIESNEGIISLSPVDWRPIIQEVIRRQEINFQKKSIALELHIPEQIPLTRGSRKAMTHILDNLVQNAINYTPQKGKISISMESNEDQVILHVKDNGVGISQQDQARIFERFYRVDTARSREVEGTGLGLAIVKHLVIQIQGTIRVKSELNKGSIFTVTLPLS